MSHVRQQIREAIATALTGLPTTGARVFQTRVYPVEDVDLPALLIYSQNEDSTPISITAPRTMERSLLLQVEAVAKGVTDLDDELDTICAEVEVALAMPLAVLDGIATSIALTATEIEIVAAEKPTGRARLSYRVDYFTAENAPTAAL